METIGGDLRQMQRTPLAAARVEALRGVGEVEVVNPYTGERHFPSTLGPAQFMGDIAFLNGGAWSMPMRTVRDTRVIEVPREAMLTLMSQIPEMSDIIITVYSARRRTLLDDCNSSLRLPA
jgi:thioredoxin reductase (NADPH)